MAGLDSDGGSTRSSSLGEEGASMRTSPSPGSTPCSTPSPTPDPGATVARHRERSSELEASSALMELFAVQLQVRWKWDVPLGGERVVFMTLSFKVILCIHRCLFVGIPSNTKRYLNISDVTKISLLRHFLWGFKIISKTFYPIMPMLL